MLAITSLATIETLATQQNTVNTAVITKHMDAAEYGPLFGCCYGWYWLFGMADTVGWESASRRYE